MTNCTHETVSIKPKKFSNGTTHLERRCNACNKHLGYAPKNPSSPKRIHFGKYSGSTFAEIAQTDRPYFLWLLEQKWLKNNVRDQIKHALEQNEVRKISMPIVSEEQQSAIDKLQEMRSQGLDYFNKPQS